MKLVKGKLDRKNTVIQYIRRTLFQEVIRLREELHKYTKNPNNFTVRKRFDVSTPRVREKLQC